MNLPSKAFRHLYLGYIISCIGDRLWTFAIIFILQYLGGMRLVGINQLIESVSAMILASYVGNWLDKTDRKKGTLTVLAINNISVAISAALLAICLTISQTNIIYTVCLTSSILFCALSKCASEGEKMAFTKDWIVVMAKNETGNTLSSRNATMTTIDQLSSVIAPIFTGFILQYFGNRTACFVFVIWNLMSWIIERYLLSKVYSEVNELSIREKNIDEENNIKKDVESITENHSTSFFSNICGLFGTYFRQNVFSAAFGLSLLYMTVLGFDGLAISHGKAQGVSEDVLGAFRSAGSVLGILGAISYSYIEQGVGVRKTGLIGLILQQLFLYLCILSIFLPGSSFDPISYAKEWTFTNWLEQFKNTIYMSSIKTASINNNTLSITENNEYTWSTFSLTGPMSSIIVFFCGITFARFGLWMADLSITQIMQENISEHERNTVFGVQNALCQFFSVLKDIIVILLPDERTFGFLIIMSVIFVIIGFIHYCWYMFKSKNQQKITIKTSPKEIEQLEPLKSV